MTDSFALLNEPRRPWLDLESLKRKFVELSTTAHPDRAPRGTEAEKLAMTNRYAALNAAWRCLSEPKDRLLHLLELELDRKPSGLQPPGADAMDLFSTVGRLCRETDQFLAERTRATSPMLKVQLFERGLERTNQLLNLQKTIRVKQDELELELRSLNPKWEGAPPVGDPARIVHLPLARLEELYRLSSYLGRWNGQIMERIVQLSL